MTADESEAHRAAERVARENYGRLVAFLAARTRDVTGAEDALAEAFASALVQWPANGLPANPAAWLLTVARRRQTDATRRRQTRDAGKEHVKLMAEEIDAATRNSGDIPDERLGLMFACAHPDIERGMRAPLILQTLLGFTAADIAAAFLVPPGTMGQRLVRAKARIRQAGIPFAVPGRNDDLAGRLDAVLEAIYAAYSKGWSEAGGTETPEIAGEAIWLGRLVVSLMPDEPEARGMLALMLYTEARRAARRSAEGAFVPLEEQNVALWDGAQIDMAEVLLHEANEAGPSGRYQIEAAIQSAHVARRLHGTNTWPAILKLYDHLMTLTGSPVVALNRAIARAETDGPQAALADVAPLADDPRMAGYQPFWAAKAHLCAEAGQAEAAYEAFTCAIGLTADSAERAYLRARRDRLRQG